MGYDISFSGRFRSPLAESDPWHERPLARPRLKLPLELLWPAAPPKHARAAPRWLVRHAKAHGEVSLAIEPCALVVRGKLSEDGFRACFGVVVAILEGLAKAGGDGALDLASLGGGADFATRVTIAAGKLAARPSDDADATTARLFRLGDDVRATPTAGRFVHDVLRVTEADAATLATVLALAGRLDPAKLLRRVRAENDDAQLAIALARADLVPLLGAPWGYSAGGSATLVSVVTGLVARAAHDEAWPEAPALDDTFRALLERTEAPLVGTIAAFALAESRAPAAFAALAAAHARAMAAGPSAQLRPMLEQALTKSRVPKRLRAASAANTTRR